MLPDIRAALKALVQFDTGPLALIIVGSADERARTVAEAALDAAGERLSIVTVSRDENGALDAYGARHHTADPDLVARQMPERPRPPTPTEPPTVPGGPDPDGRVLLDDDTLSWFEACCEILHSRTGLSADSIEGVGLDYYKGRVISWFELSTEVDVVRLGPVNSLKQTVERMLLDRGTRRHRYDHAPGAGGTTVSRRVAWALHDDYPVLVATGLVEGRVLGDRIRELGRLTDRQVLVVVDNSTDAAIDPLYDQLRADSVPALLLLVGRRTTQQPRDGRAGQLDRYLGPLHDDEKGEFVSLFGQLVPSRRDALVRAASRGADSSVPFLLALAAFEDDYRGLPDYVRRSLDGTNARHRTVLAAIALAHRYAGVAMPANAFAPALNLPRDAPVRLRSVLTEHADGLVLEETPGMWRTTHPLVAQEILKQLLAPDGATTGRLSGHAWRTGLAQRCIALIKTIADAYPQELPTEARDLLERLFILRDSREFGSGRRTHSEVLQAIPATEGRLEVLRVLAETFPEEPHYWAQYGRLLSYLAADHPKAREALDQALALDPRDTVLWHISGVVRRNEIRGLLRHGNRHQPTDAGREAAVQHSTTSALDDLARASELNDQSEYPHVTAAHLCVEVIEWAKKRAGTKTYVQFLRMPGGEFYADLLDTAEEALERLAELVGDDTPSRYAEEAAAELRQIYDDYSGLLEGWRNILSRSDVIKAPVRRRLVRAYRNRAGGWRAATRAQRQQALTLLEENLRDDPADGLSVREWLRLARFTGGSLDRAAELVSYWAEREPSRDSLFYQAVIYALLALEGRESALTDYRRATQRCRERAQVFPNRRAVYEWLGPGDSLRRLVHHTDLLDWERSKADAPDPALLARITGRVVSISRAQSGQIEFGPGIAAFFTPSVAGLVAGRDENRLVTALLGFSYDGPQAWSVRPAGAAS